MADSIKISTVTAAIAAKTITVTNALGNSVTLAIKDTGAMPEAIHQENCPLLVPRPADFVTALRIERDSFGADAAYKSIYYTLNYLFFFCPAVQGMKLHDKYDEMVTASAAVILSLGTNTNVSGSTEFEIGSVDTFGYITDGEGAAFYGCVIPINIRQFMET